MEELQDLWGLKDHGSELGIYVGFSRWLYMFSLSLVYEGSCQLLFLRSTLVIL